VRIYFGGLIAVTQIPPSTARATTTLAIVDQKHNQMIVASDSLRLTSNGIISVTSQVCKILVGPNCIFSVAGYVSNSSTNFDLDKLGNEACHEAGTITDKANVFDKLADKPADYVQYIRETAPESYENMKKHGVASAIFLGRENEHFTICLRDFTVRESGVDVHWTNFEDTTAGIVPFVAIGTAELFKAYKETHKNWVDHETVSLARFLVQLEIDAHPNEVSPPISILKVTPQSGEANGIKTDWIEKGECQPKTLN
jgi:hypothetical protein